MPDAALRAAIQGAIGVLPGVPLTKEKLQEVISLNVENKGVYDITGLEFATSLTELRHLYLSDVSPITLNLDISPLANLIHLEALFLENSRVSDISLLAGLKKLRILDLTNNQILDFSPLAGLMDQGLASQSAVEPLSDA